ncbi:MAG: multicopper oxidase family protein [Alphaproteobacteria bacterium]|nr:multicopper oxidase family protein [Alphaproteobacteria bacterium]
MRPTRRGVLAGAGAALLAPELALAANGPRRLAAQPGTQRLAGLANPATRVWGYGGATPGPVLRYRQGARLDITLENELSEATTIHWHGVRTPHAMDGVGGVSQAPVPPRGRFTYAFDLKDAGTFWYHAHHNSHRQIARGLYGALIVEEASPMPVDRDEVWVLADWRLDRDGKLVEDFLSPMDASHAGRLGNTVTVNGAVTESFGLRQGERLRLRLINAANARIFGLTFEGHAPWVIALDGQPVDPHQPQRLDLGPGQRADLVLDATGDPGGRYRVVDAFSSRQSYRLLDLVYSGAQGRARSGAPPRLPDNPIPRPDLAFAVKRRIVFGGGAMDPALRGKKPSPEEEKALREHFAAGRFWTVNGQRHTDHAAHKPIFEIKRGASAVVEIVNQTVWPHPIHFHGVVFDVLAQNGAKPARAERRDTVLLLPGENAEIAFRAEEPGDWMIHCHILEHQESGMMALMRVT